MSKKQSFKPPYRQRTAVPKLAKGENGSNILLCPFCSDPHPIMPFVASPCGTMVTFYAEQTIYRAKADKRFICAKCGEGGGEMVKWNDAFVHTPDCKPGVKTLTEPPKYSWLAKVVHGMKDGKMKDYMQQAFGRAVAVDEVTPDGKLTGTVLGYFFHRKKNVKDQNGSGIVQDKAKSI